MAEAKRRQDNGRSEVEANQGSYRAQRGRRKPRAKRGRAQAEETGASLSRKRGSAPVPVQPIRPPPCMVIATTAGRTGMASEKSGQRVERSS